jgi:pilus assembly protein CpaE
MNRVGADNQEITLKKAEETIGKPIFWQVPNDSKAMLSARNCGEPLIIHAPRSKACQSIQALAAALAEGGPEVPAAANGAPAKKEKKGFLFF